MKGKLILTALLSLAALIEVLASGCSALKGAPEGARGDTRQIRLIVMSNMVTNADDSPLAVRFVDLPPEDIVALRARCGNRYPIYAADRAALRIRKSDSGRLEQRRLILMGSELEGVLLKASVDKIGKRSAQAIGLYQNPDSSVGVRFYLRRTSSGWLITSVEPGYAS